MAYTVEEKISGLVTFIILKKPLIVYSRISF